MGFFGLLLLAVGLSMDAFAVAVCKGLALQKVTLRKAALVGLWFGGFQALMPTLGFFLGEAFERYIRSFDHWIAFGLLALIGVNMIREALGKEEAHANASLAFRAMLVLALATSIDALAAGISLACSQLDSIWLAAGLIGATTFTLSCAGVWVGSVFGARYQRKAEFAGGVILILLGVRILIEHLS